MKDNIVAHIKLINKEGEIIEVTTDQINLTTPNESELLLELTQNDISLKIKFEKK
jgi:hypothetical protein